MWCKDYENSSFFFSRESNIKSDNSQNVGFEDHNNISDGIFPHFTTPFIKITKALEYKVGPNVSS